LAILRIGGIGTPFQSPAQNTPPAVRRKLEKMTQLKIFHKMEKPIFEYKNILRNILTIGLWLIIAIGLYFIIFVYKGLNSIIIVLISIFISSFFFWPIKLFKTFVYNDAIVFKDFLRHPILNNEYGILFENIFDYKIKRIAFSLYWIVFKRRNGKTIRRLFSLSKTEYLGFTQILTEKVLKLNS
jgi:hypothetical protein